MKPQLSLSEVGAILNLERRQVWHIERQAFKKLRKRLAHLFDAQESLCADSTGAD